MNLQRLKYLSGFISLIVLNITSSACFCSAADQTASSKPPLPLSALPSPYEKDAHYYINSSNLALFEDGLLAPIAVWIKNGQAVFPAVRELKESWRSSSGWQTILYPKSNPPILGEDGSLLNLTTIEGLPFGPAEEINREQDAVKQAQKIFWNVQFAEAQSGRLNQKLELSWFDRTGISKKGQATLYREYSLPVDGDGFSLSFKRELFQFLAPAAINNYSMITWKYLADREHFKEDEFWIYSPISKKTRHLFESNRSDGMVDGILSLDDLFVWNNNIHSFSPKVVASKLVFLPYSNLDFITSETKTTNNESQIAPQWNAISSDFPRAAAWLPTGVYFVPRNCWIIELIPLDPYSADGRQIVVVDQENMLPFYRIVYDQSGRYKKIVVGSWALQTKPRLTPISTFVVAVDGDRTHAVGVLPIERNFVTAKEQESFTKTLFISSYEKELTADTKKKAAAPSGQSSQNPAEDARD